MPWYLLFSIQQGLNVSGPRIRLEGIGLRTSLDLADDLAASFRTMARQYSWSLLRSSIRARAASGEFSLMSAKQLTSGSPRHS